MKKLFENFHSELLYMETVKSLLDDWMIVKFADRESVKRYKKTIENTISECMDRKYHVLRLIESFEDPVMRDIFYMRYIDRKSHEEIAHKVGYCVTGISKQIRKGIQYLEAKNKTKVVNND